MPFIPDDFAAPSVQHFDQFVLEVLSPKFTDQDFAAVVASPNDIRYVFGPNNAWPSPQMTLTENLADVTRHEKEFVDRKAFAYAIRSLDGERYLGCVYIKPIKSRIENDLRKSLYDAQVFFWVSSIENTGNLDQLILVNIQDWLQKAWPFKATAFPGRTINWQEWEQMEHAVIIE
ncbi:hypothetical protein [Glaciimonas soli]|uniref:N-acetyltransferase domain-containing protein n=1 Tax=Glaciimonas soli TaxID=2590999 RepID=A0A843YZ08_9BURK|nr:hypothetical protein [Glaciimonas soli]MQR02442.1 hypothetical protein [Glaciimonas soli]